MDQLVHKKRIVISQLAERSDRLPRRNEMKMGRISLKDESTFLGDSPINRDCKLRCAPE